MCIAVADIILALKALEMRGQELATTYWAERTKCTFEAAELLKAHAAEKARLLVQELVAVTDRVPPDSVLLFTGRCGVCDTCIHARSVEMPFKVLPWAPLWCALWCAWTSMGVRGLSDVHLALWSLPESCADMVCTVGQRWMQHGFETKEQWVFDFGVRLMRARFE